MSTSPDQDRPPGDLKAWVAKFRFAGRGLLRAIRTNNSFLVHLPVAATVVASAVWLELTSGEIAILLVCIGTVLVAELFNSSLEYLSRSVTDSYRTEIEWALDIAAAAVLMACIMAVIVGAFIFIPHLPIWTDHTEAF